MRPSASEPRQGVPHRPIDVERRLDLAVQIELALRRLLAASPIWPYRRSRWNLGMHTET